MLPPLQGIAVEDLDPVRTQHGIRGAPHLFDQLLRLGAAPAHQLRRCGRLQPVELVINRLHRNLQRLLCPVIGGQDRGLTAADHLHHQAEQRGEQQPAGILSLGNCLEPGIQLLKVKTALQHCPSHRWDRKALGQAFQKRGEQSVKDMKSL